MLYWLTEFSDGGGDVFNLFRYITFRAGGGAFFTALIFGFIFGKPPLINILRKRQGKGQPFGKTGHRAIC